MSGGRQQYAVLVGEESTVAVDEGKVRAVANSPGDFSDGMQGVAVERSAEERVSSGDAWDRGIGKSEFADQQLWHDWEAAVGIDDVECVGADSGTVECAMYGVMHRGRAVEAVAAEYVQRITRTCAAPEVHQLVFIDPELAGRRQRADTNGPSLIAERNGVEHQRVRLGDHPIAGADGADLVCRSDLRRPGGGILRSQF